MNVTDYNGSGNYTRKIFRFKTESRSNQENYPPIIFGEDPRYASISVPLDRSFLSVNISDLEGDLFNWSIETKPDIGNNSANEDSNGIKICSISNLKLATEYTWYVNVTDYNGSEDWNREFFSFKTESPPNKPKNPDPENNQIHVSRRPILFVKVNDPDNDLMNVSFYFSDGTLIGNDYNVSNFDRWAVFSIDEYLEYNRTYSWYAISNDGKYSNRSKTWNFTTWSEEYKNSLLDISFPKRMYCACVKADIKNNCEENILDANWSISINGGILDGIDIKKQGYFDIDSGDTIMISSRDLSLKDRIVRKFGLINVTINVFAYGNNFFKYSRGLVLGRFVFLFGNIH